MYILIKYADETLYILKQIGEGGTGTIIRPVNEQAKEDYKRYQKDKSDWFWIDLTDSEILERNESLEELENNLGIYLL